MSLYGNLTGTRTAQERKLIILSEMQRPCYDNGKKFIVTDKLDRISQLLSDTSYVETQENLFRLYSKVPLNELNPEHLIVLSTHADFVSNIRRPFVKVSYSQNLLLGTFDNSATNAAALYLLLEGNLPENVLVAFTGNEEYGMKGAAKLDQYLQAALGVSPFYLALDVTDIGFRQKQFSIENTFSLPRDTIENLVHIVKGTGHRGYLYPNALPDEAHQYSRIGALSCSLCVPTQGPMHSNKGCYMELSAYFNYIDVLEHLSRTFDPPCITRLEGMDI